MKKTLLRDKPTGVVHDLTKLVGEDTEEEVTVGREGYGCRIELGKGLPKRKHPHFLRTVSKCHATIRYQYDFDGEGFYIRDHSKNGIGFGPYLISLERARLRDGDKLFFGGYGPVIVEEVEGKEK